jgi:hypothetical protein
MRPIRSDFVNALSPGAPSARKPSSSISLGVVAPLDVQFNPVGPTAPPPPDAPNMVMADQPASKPFFTNVPWGTLAIVGILGITFHSINRASPRLARRSR